jgi:hypothetical protein
LCISVLRSRISSEIVEFGFGGEHGRCSWTLVLVPSADLEERGYCSRHSTLSCEKQYRRMGEIVAERLLRFDRWKQRCSSLHHQILRRNNEQNERMQQCHVVQLTHPVASKPSRLLMVTPQRHLTIPEENPPRKGLKVRCRVRKPGRRCWKVGDAGVGPELYLYQSSVGLPALRVENVAGRGWPRG